MKRTIQTLKVPATSHAVNPTYIHRSVVRLTKHPGTACVLPLHVIVVIEIVYFTQECNIGTLVTLLSLPCDNNINGSPPNGFSLPQQMSRIPPPLRARFTPTPIEPEIITPPTMDDHDKK